MLYPCVVEPGKDGHPFGVIFPDLPGCYPSGETLEEALKDAKECAQVWMEDMLDEGLEINPPSSADEIMKNPDYKGWILAYVDINPDFLSDKVERINICLPKRLIWKLDDKAKKAGLSRSAFIAESVIMR